MPRPRTTALSAAPTSLFLLASALTFACGPSSEFSSTGGSGGSTGTTTTASGGSGGSGGSTGGSGGSTGGASDCPQAATMLDVSKAPGAGASYPKPTLTAKCVGDKFVVDSNDIPPYTFVQTTPNPLTGHDEHYEIPRNPQVAAANSTIPLLGVVGFAVNGLPFFGPNEAAQPADEAYGDPVYNGLMDACLGHTSPGEYHYHSMLVKCLNQDSLVEEPWMNADPPADQASPVIAWALDGFPIYGPLECTDSSCATVVEMKSGYDQIGDPHSHAWDAYQWTAKGDPTYLDECNGHTGPGGDYHYHVTETFPYILGCFHGTTDAGGGGGGGGTGGAGQGGGGQGGMGPQSCQSAADCTNACPPGSKGCTCANSPMGMICVPTCTTSADCPSMPGMTLQCNNGICVP